MSDIMNDEDFDPEIEIALRLTDPKHPIYKVMLGLVAVLSALWMNSTV